MKAIFVAASAAAILATAPVWAQSTTQPAAGREMNNQDRDFLAKASAGGAAEVEAGQLAQQKASDPAVKQFGQHMVADHSKGNDQLTAVVQREGLPLPSSPKADQAQQRELSKLRA